MSLVRRKIPTGSLFHKAYKDSDGKTRHSRTWSARYYVDGRRIELSTGSADRADALVFLRKKMAAVHEQRNLSAHPERVRLGQLFDLLLENYRRKERRSTYDVERKIEKKNGLRAYFGDIRAIDLSTALIAGYIRKRQAEPSPPANSSLNRELAYVRRAMILGTEMDPPLVTRVPKFEMFEESGNIRQGTLTHEQYRAIRDSLPIYARVALVIGYHTGARKGEIRQMRRERIDFKAKRIELPGHTTKNKEPRYLPIYGDMAAEIEMALATGSPKCPWLLQNQGRTVYDFEKAWHTACELAGIPGALFHDLRRVAVTNMIEAGIPESEVMKIIGHKTRSMLVRYHIVAPQRLQEIGGTLEAHMKAKDTENPTGRERIN
jgi:integrase